MTTGSPETTEIITVPMGRWAVAAAPVRLRTLLGSCAGVVLYDRAARVGGLSHIVLPASMGATEQPGKFADTAIPGMIDELGKLTGRKGKSHLWAKIIGGARMFPGGPALNIGQKNQDAVEKILAELGLPVVARDVGGDMGRRVTFDTASGLVCIRAPGGEDYHI